MRWYDAMWSTGVVIMLLGSAFTWIGFIGAVIARATKCQ